MKTTTTTKGEVTIATTRGPGGTEVDLVLEERRRAHVYGGIPNYAASTHSLQYRDAPVGWASEGSAAAPSSLGVAPSALINGF